jgi:hypothetical protein
MEDKIETGRMPLLSFEGVSKFKSINRAIKRGHVSPIGVIAPKRPFNNRKDTLGRLVNIRKKEIYGALKQRGI